nr:LAGLIDADG family homing endonuclease [Methanothermus fervidus]
MKNEEIIKKFEEFFSLKYKDEVYEVLENYPDEKSIVVDYVDLEMFNIDLADYLIEKPEECMSCAEEAIKQLDPSGKNPEIHVRFKNVFPQVNLRDLKSEHIGKLVCVEGIVRKTEEVRPRIAEGTFVCEKCYSVKKVPQEFNKITKPARCEECGSRSFRLEKENSKFVDTQTLKIQEPLEQLAGGEQPRQITLVLEDDLVDIVSPGDVVRITGILKTMHKGRNRFKNFIYGNYVEFIEQEFEEVEISEEDEKKIKELAKDSEIRKKIINSILPSIYGHEEIKEAVALQLFGGVPKELADGTRLRGDIHVLMIGDPGIGKSQMLKYVSKLAPRGIYTSGKGTTGVGLTAAAIRDEFGGWSLEAGALVLGDKGVVCIDELDKMREEDRSAIHEALEQQSYHKDFEILLANGRKMKIGNFVDELMEKNKNKIIYGKDTEILMTDDLDLKVMAYDLKNLKIIPANVNRISRHKAPDKFVKIKFENGRNVTVTPEHPFVVWDKDIKIVRADEIKEGMVVLGVNNYEISGNSSIDPNIAKFLGFILSGECTYKDGFYEIVFSNANKKLLEEFETIVKKLGIKYNISKKKEGHKTFTVKIASKEFYHDLITEFPELSLQSQSQRFTHVKVPNKILMSSKSVKKAFLNAYFKRSGFVDNCRVGYSTPSIKMAEDLQDLLLMMGIYSYISKDERTYKVIIDGEENIKKFAKIIKDDFRIGRINDLIETSGNKNNQDQNILENEIVQDIEDDEKSVKISNNERQRNIRFIKVKNVKFVENSDSKWVYDITVEPHHLFVSHGIVLHNSISIAKAGIMATLNSRCSVLAAANPKFGRFDRYKSISEQINLPSTILSRFDLIFVIEDLPNKDRDRRLAEHVLKIHQARDIKPEIDPELLRKYIAYARKYIKPKLTKDAREVIEDFYVSMRSKGLEEDSPVPITVRQLESIVRLAEASARMKLKDKVEVEDAKRAIRLVEACLKQLGYDPETGKIDIDKVEGRTPKSKRDKYNAALELIKELEDEYESVPESMIISEMNERYNIDENETKEILKTLRDKGMIYKDRDGGFGTV